MDEMDEMDEIPLLIYIRVTSHLNNRPFNQCNSDDNERSKKEKKREGKENIKRLFKLH